jgi:hypothetical protein
MELAVEQLAHAGAGRALALLAGNAQPGDYSVYTGPAELTPGRVLAAGGQTSEACSAATRAAQQLANAEGADHTETRAADQLSHARPLDEKIR